MKLILSVDALCQPMTGIGRYTWELATRLPSYSDVKVLRFYNSGKRIKKIAGLRTGNESPNRFFKEPKWFTKWRLPRACRGHIFHAPNYFLPAYAQCGVATIHDLSVFKYPETHPLERIRQFEREFESTLARASHLITDSEAVRREIIEMFGVASQKITAVPLGVSTKFTVRQDEELHPILKRYALSPGAYSCCISTLEPRKKIDTLLAAYKLLPKKLIEQYPLVLAGGRGWRDENLILQIENAVNEGWLRYLGYMPDEELSALYAGARAFIYPSVYEGFGLPLLEAMASGIPVITSNCSSLSEVSGGAALLVEPGDITELRNAIEKALLDTAWRAEARSKGLAIAGKHSWDNCMQRTMMVYREVAP